MEKKVKIIIGVVVGVAVIGGIAYYMNTKKKLKKVADANVSDSDDEYIINDSSQSDLMTKSSVAINPKLKWVENPDVATFLAGELSEEQMTKLRGWVDLIKKERAKDSSKWKDSNGLSGQVSDIGHGMYQMKVWSTDILYGLKDAQ